MGIPNRQAPPSLAGPNCIQRTHPEGASTDNWGFFAKGEATEGPLLGVLLLPLRRSQATEGLGRSAAPAGSSANKAFAICWCQV